MHLTRFSYIHMQKLTVLEVIDVDPVMWLLMVYLNLLHFDIALGTHVYSH